MGVVERVIMNFDTEKEMERFLGFSHLWLEERPEKCGEGNTVIWALEETDIEINELVDCLEAFNSYETYLDNLTR